MDISAEYSERFNHRQSQFQRNLLKLNDISHPGGSKTLDDLPKLVSSRTSDDPRDAYRWSIIMLWLQATECYIFGQYESCILTAGAVIERCLKLEYLEVNSSLPEGNWTLGKCIYNLEWTNTRVTRSVLDNAKEILEPRNSRAHALLEHSDPQLSIMGGNRDVQVLSSERYLIEPYRAEASKVISKTWHILDELYS